MTLYTSHELCQTFCLPGDTKTWEWCIHHGVVHGNISAHSPYVQIWHQVTRTLMRLRAVLAFPLTVKSVHRYKSAESILEGLKKQQTTQLTL